jgi:Cu+-exporting ATPase
MIRRQFLQLVALSSAASLAPLDALAGTDHTTVVYRVKGFTCITCAVGLDTLLRREKGIISSESTYPEGKVTVSYDSKVRNEDSICALIADMGFTVESFHKA